MNTFKLSIPLHMNMDYVNIVMSKVDETKFINLTEDVLEVEIYDDEDPDSLRSQLNNLWCSMSPSGSVGFVDFIQTFGAVEPNPFGRGDEGEPACLVADDRTAQDLISQAAANGLTKTELLSAIQSTYGDADEAIEWPPVEPNPFGRGDEGEPTLHFS